MDLRLVRRPGRNAGQTFPVNLTFTLSELRERHLDAVAAGLGPEKLHVSQLLMKGSSLAPRGFSMSFTNAATGCSDPSSLARDLRTDVEEGPLRRHGVGGIRVDELVSDGGEPDTTKPSRICGALAARKAPIIAELLSEIPARGEQGTRLAPLNGAERSWRYSMRMRGRQFSSMQARGGIAWHRERRGGSRVASEHFAVAWWLAMAQGEAGLRPEANSTFHTVELEDAATELTCGR